MITSNLCILQQTSVNINGSIQQITIYKPLHHILAILMGRYQLQSIQKQRGGKPIRHKPAVWYMTFSHQIKILNVISLDPQKYCGICGSFEENKMRASWFLAASFLFCKAYRQETLIQRSENGRQVLFDTSENSHSRQIMLTEARVN